LKSLRGELSGLLSHVDTVEELTFILLADLANLADLGAGEGDGSVVNTAEDKLILDIFGKNALDAGLHLDLPGVSTAQEVVDLNVGSGGVNFSVNREMSIHQFHLVSEDLLAACEHVLNQGSKGVNTGGVLVGTEPHADADVSALTGLGILFHRFDLTREVRKVLLELAFGALNTDFAGLDLALNVSGNRNPLFSQQLPHFAYIFFIK